MLELLGILCLVQGVGGLINRLAGSTNRSWFGPLYLVGPDYQIAISIAVAVVGLALIILASRLRTARR